MNALSWTVGTVDSPSVRGVRQAFSETLRTLGRTHDEISDGTIILGELLANAFEHGKLPIHVKLLPSGKQWHLSVTDSGSGFVRGAAAFDPLADRGRGLQIVERLGGRIRVLSESSTIEVTLPFGD